jgi:uncharacterized protein (DUF1501 family)
VASALSSMADPAGRSPLASMIARSNGDLLSLQKSLAVVPNADQSSDGTDESELADQLGFVSRAMVANVPTKVWAVSLGGFDTHANEKATHDRLMADLDGAVQSFFSAIGDRQAVMMIYSEFGRRVAANASDGTDHGTAAPVLVIGPAVRGGLYGDQPSFTDLDDGDLKFTTDYRRVYSTVLTSVLGIDSKDVLGAAFDPVPFL